MNTKRFSGLLLAALMLVGSVSVVRAADEETKTITGVAMCAKIDLQTQSEHQTVIQVKDENTAVTYYVIDNDVAKAFHSKICGHPTQVTATGTIKEENGRMELTPTALTVVEATPKEE